MATLQQPSAFKDRQCQRLPVVPAISLGEELQQQLFTLFKSKLQTERNYDPQLIALAGKAKNVNGYMVQVKGYASASGSVALNQKLSEEPANNVTNVLLQLGHIPAHQHVGPGRDG